MKIFILNITTILNCILSIRGCCIFLFIVANTENAASQQIIQKLIWSNNVGNAPNSIINTDDGGYLVSGLTYDGLGDSTKGLIIKLDSIDNITWAKTITNNSSGYRTSIDKALQLTNGNYLLYGTSIHFGLQISHLILALMDNNGNLLNSKSLRFPSGLYHRIIEMIESYDGTIYLCGFNNYGDNYQLPGFDRKNALLIKTDSLLNISWANEYHYRYTDYFSSIKQHPDHNIYLQVSSWDSLPPGREDIFLYKVDTSGNLNWAKQCGDNPPQNILNPTARAGCIEILPNGNILNVYHTNWFNSFDFKYLLIQKLDTSGNAIISNHYYYSTGLYENVVSANTDKILINSISNLMSLDSNLNPVWRNRYLPPFISNIQGTPGVVRTNQGGFASASGYLSGNSWKNIYLSLIDSTGDIGCQNYVYSIPVVQPQNINIVDVSSLVMQNNISVNDSTLSYSIHNIVTYDSVLCNTYTGVNQPSDPITIEAFPNPSNEFVTLSSTVDLTGSILELYDSCNKCVWKQEFLSNRILLNGLNSGVYYLYVRNKMNRFIIKLIKF